jgi:hypothetical protein
LQVLVKLASCYNAVCLQTYKRRIRKARTVQQGITLFSYRNSNKQVAIAAIDTISASRSVADIHFRTTAFARISAMYWLVPLNFTVPIAEPTTTRSVH